MSKNDFTVKLIVLQVAATRYAAMCPLWPLHYVVMYAVLLWPLFAVAAQVVSKSRPSPRSARSVKGPLYCEPPPGAGYLDVHFSQQLANGTLVDVYKEGWNLELKIDERGVLPFDTSDLVAADLQDGELFVESADPFVADTGDKQYELNTVSLNGGSFSDAFNVAGKFLGKTNVRLRLRSKKAAADRFSDCVPVVVTRPKRPIDTAFTVSVASLVAIIFVNFGCALDWELVKKTVRRPVGPAIGFTSQYIVLPLVSESVARAWGRRRLLC